MKRKLIALLALLMVASAGELAYAGIQVSSDGNRGAANQVLTAVFNDSGSTLTSGSVVIWDTGAADPANAGLGAYVTTTTSADSNLAAGVVFSDQILDQGIGTICTYGPVETLTADATDRPTSAGTAVGTTTVAGQAGSGTGLGVLLRTSASGSDRENEWVFVNPSNAE